MCVCVCVWVVCLLDRCVKHAQIIEIVAPGQEWQMKSEDRFVLFVVVVNR